jgi:hypothetical protein
MSSAIVIKIYNKQDELNLIVQETELFKIVSLYKYDGKNEDIHSFTYIKNSVQVDMSKWKYDITTYYDFLRRANGVMVERIWITDKQLESTELLGNYEEIKINKIFDSNNIYEERKKVINGEECVSEFKNGEFRNFRFKIPENKINEYLKKRQDEQKI